ncbi:MAG: YkgJ family cysteine cluster protein [Deltaproteobacteria bacterium]|nr:YkgJ family cysteine cluster protein [Deltaproteobacteria bacterium]
MEKFKQLSAKSSFCFSCEKGIACYNKCCGDINIFLTPYDVLRMQKHLGVSSDEFLSKYCIQPFTKEQKLPVVLLKMQDTAEKECPFVREEGCSIYADRPWSCRMYPIGLASQKVRSEDTGGEEFYFLQEDAFCQGHATKKEWNVGAWVEDQGALLYEKFSSLYREIILHSYFKKGKDLGPKKMDMFHMVFYKLDTFREFIFESSFLKRFEVDDKTLDAIKTDDFKLMRFGVDWLKFSLFGEDTMTIRGEIKEKILGELNEESSKDSPQP